MSLNLRPVGILHTLSTPDAAAEDEMVITKGHGSGYHYILQQESQCFTKVKQAKFAGVMLG